MEREKHRHSHRVATMLATALVLMAMAAPAVAQETGTLRGKVTLTETGDPVHEDVTVTASVGGAETTFEAFNAVTTIDSFDIVGGAEGSLDDALRNEPGIASRSFGLGRAGRSSAASTATAS